MARAWHLLSLDAPTVAVTWCVAFARATMAAGGSPTTDARAGWAPVFLMLATWVCYVGDRVLDARPGGDPARLRARHRFYGALRQQRRTALAVAFCAAAISSLVIGLRLLPTSLLVSYAALSMSALAYFAWVHLGSSTFTRALPKEAVVGVIFAGGCALPAWDAAAPTTRLQLLPSIAVFAMLCWLNCVAIERWEGGDAGPIDTHPSTAWAARHLRALLVIGAMASGALGASSARNGAGWFLAPFLAAAFALLVGLDSARHRFTKGAIRVLVDAALLTPLFWSFGWTPP